MTTIIPGTLYQGSGGFQLHKGDRVQVGGYNFPGNIYSHANTHFNGVLIRPDA